MVGSDRPKQANYVPRRVLDEEAAENGRDAVEARAIDL
jgi:hypothetical protein